MKKYLTAKRSARSLPELQAQIDRFVTYYNESRPHRGIGRKTPVEVFDAKIKAHPRFEERHQHFRIRHDRVDRCGKLTLRYESRLRHIGMGAAYAGQRVVLLIADADVRVTTPDGELLRTLTLDPRRDYHPQTLGWVSTMT
jgi:Integrase core domain